LNQMADGFMDYMIKNFRPIDGARAVKTWLSTYQLPLDPSLISSFDEFHNRFGPYIINHGNSVTAFEKD